MAANKEIKNWINDLRITDDCKGAYLTIDDNLNVAWKQGTTETRTGEVWQYNSITQDSYVILPQASVNIGLCVALMRNKTDSGTNPKLVILPEKTNGEYDTIQGSKNFYTSAGVSIDSTGKITESQDDDSFSSIIFKAVQMGNNQYGWVIINGVGSWNGESITDTIYETVKAKYTQQAISVQTAGANTLSTSGGLGSTQSEFVEFTGLKKYPKSVKGSTEVELKPFNGNDSLQYMVIAAAGNDWTNYFYSGNVDIASFNVFGKQGSKFENNYYSAGTVNTNILDSSVNWLGYTFRRTPYNGNVSWCQDNRKKSYTYQLVKNKLIMIYDDVNQINRLGTAQITIPVDLNNFKLANNKSLTEVNKVYMDLDFGAEQNANNDWKCYHIIAYKVPATWNDAYTVNSNNIGKVIPLKFQGDGRSINLDLYSSNLVGIPLTEEDKANGKFNLVFEFIIDDESGNRTESEFAKNFPNNNVYYSKFRFIGFEQLKQVSISPEVEFEQFGAWGGKEYHGSITGNSSSNLVIYNNAYIDASITDDKIATDWVPNVSYTGFQYKPDTITQTYKTFFNQFGSYKPSSNITKTIISANGGFPGQSEDSNPASALTYELVIDWVNRNWQFTGFLKGGNWAYHCTQQNEFSDNPITLDFTACSRNTSGTRLTTKRLPDSILINGSGIIRLPYLLKYSSNYLSGEGISLTWNFTHYKTIVNPSGYPVEVLCHYKCGWERAENVWSTNYKADGSEFDGLLEYPNDSSSNGLVSPSKTCISPTHYRMKPDAYNVEFTTDRGLLPYYKEFNCNHNGTKKPCYFFNTQYVYNNQAYPNTSDSGSDQWLNADAFCTLTFTPKTTGLLKGYIRIPQLVRSGAGRLIIKEIYNEANHTWSDYIMVKDDFGGSTRGLQILAPDTEFSDKVNAYEKIRYSVILYSTVNHDSGNQDAFITSISRAAFPTGWDHWISDFKTLYDKNYISGYSIGTGATGGGSNSSTMRKVFGREPSATGGAFVNSIEGKERMFTSDNVDVDKFARSFYYQNKKNNVRASIASDLSQSNPNADTTSANMGSPFEFLVYVMKTA